VHEQSQVYNSPKIIDPRRLLRVLTPYARFQAGGYQVIGGVRLKVLRASNPGNLTRRNLLPVMYSLGLSVGSLTVWVDGQGVVHRMAFTFISYAGIMPGKPVSTAALRGYQRAQRAEARTIARLQRYHARTGKRIPERPLRLPVLRVDQALKRAYPIRRGTQVTTTTVTFSFIGQPQRITAPRNAISYRQAEAVTSSHH
jgi:hypothetical protein